MRNVEWDSTQVTGTDVTSLNFPDDFFAVATNLVSKLSNFAFLRANMRVRIMVQGQQFQNGQLLVWFWPYERHVTQTFRDLHTSLTSKSGFPHVVVDVAAGMPVEIVLPYVSPLAGYPLTSGKFMEFGTVHVTVLSKLASAAATSANVSIYAAMEDVEVQVPTGEPNEVTTLRNERARHQYIYALNGKMTPTEIGGQTDSEMATELGSGIRVPQSSVAEMVKGGVGAEPSIGKIVHSIPLISDIANEIEKIPIVGDLAKGVESMGVGDAMSMAAMVGFSKPAPTEPAERVTTVPFPGQSHGYGSDYSDRFSLHQNCQLKPLTGLGGTDDDEMDIRYIGNRMNYLTSYPVTTATPVGSSLATLVVAPTATRQINGAKPDGTADNTDYNYCEATQAAYVCNLFEYWRCKSMRYRIVAVKTGFHSARIRISYHPTGGTNALDRDANNAYNKVFDLRESSTMEFSCPWVSPTPWKVSDSLSVNGSATASSLLAYALGSLKIELLTKLVAPDTVSNRIDLLVWVATEDLQVACPNVPRALPLVYKANSAAVKKDDDIPTPSSDRKTQMLNEVNGGQTSDPEESSEPLFTIGSTLTSDPYATCTGESVVSLRPLTRRYAHTERIATTASTPYYYLFAQQPTTFTNDLLEFMSYESPKSLVDMLYQFHRGGERLYWKCREDNGSGGVSVKACLTHGNDLPAKTGLVTVGGGTFRALHRSGVSYTTQITGNSMGQQVERPYYGNTPFVVSHENGSVNKPFSGCRYRGLLLRFIPLSSGSIDIMTSAADDYTCHFMIGAPLLYYRRYFSPRIDNPFDY